MPAVSKEMRAMSDVTPATRTRLWDWANLVFGVFLALAPTWFTVTTSGAWAMVVTGLVIAVLAVIALEVPAAAADEWLMVAAGVVAFVAPWLFGFTGNGAAAWTSWTAGALVTLFALVALPASRRAHRVQYHAM
jgi:uncharacterized membrane protein